MKTLKDFYIVVTKQNEEQLEELLNIPAYEGYNISFDCDDPSSCTYKTRIKNKQRISLSKLKRYIDNTPTREGLKKAQNASKIYKYKYEQEKQYSKSYSDLLENYLEEIDTLQKERNLLKDTSIKLSERLREKVVKYNDMYSTLRNIEKSIPQENKLIDSTVIDWVNDVIKERDSIKHSNERLQYNLDNLRSEREQLTYLAKKDINLGKKTLIEWTCDMYNNEKYLQKECTVLGISNKNLELNNTKLNLENDQLNKELRKYKIVAMCSLLLTLLALGLWF